MIQNALAQVDKMDNDLIVVVHTMAEEEARFLQKQLQEKTGARQVSISTAGRVICTAVLKPLDSCIPRSLHNIL